jgi:CubicO group peptidase (beta-lactamase class C family)
MRHGLLFLVLIILVPFSGDLFGQNKQKELSELFDTLFVKNQFNGCVLVAERGRMLLNRAYGVADLNTKRKLDTASVFELASVSKGFTAMAIMQLKERGKLSYDDSLRRFFPASIFSGILIRNLLTHTSGLPDFLRWNEHDIDLSKVQSNDDIIKVLNTKKLLDRAKSKSVFDYSNTNYLLLASIVEKVSGMSFAEYLHKNIFTPAGMSQTKVHRRIDRFPSGNYAFDYAWNGSLGKFVSADSLKQYTYCMSGVRGAYGISSNTGDLYKWDQAILHNLLVSEATKEEAFRPMKFDGSDQIIRSGQGLPYVYGWELLSESESDDMFGSGNYGAYKSLVVRNVSKGQTIVLLTNFNDISDVMSIMGNVDEILDGKKPVLSPPVKFPYGLTLSIEELRLLEGVYSSPDMPDIRIKLFGKNLYLQSDNGMAQNIFPESQDTFFLTSSETKVRFGRDKKGIAEKIILMSGSSQKEMTLKR